MDKICNIRERQIKTFHLNFSNYLTSDSHTDSMILNDKLKKLSDLILNLEYYQAYETHI